MAEDNQKIAALWSTLRDKDAVSMTDTASNLLDDLDVKIDPNAPKPEKKEFDKTERYTYDLVMVFKIGSDSDHVKVKDPVTNETKKVPQKEFFQNETATVLNSLEKAGIKLDLWKSVQKDEIYCRLGVPEHRLEEEADRVEYDLPLDHVKCLEYGTALDIRLAKATGKFADIPPEAWLNLYGKYKQLDPKHAYRQQLYKRHYVGEEFKGSPHYCSFFNSIDRIKLTITIIEAEKNLGGAGLSFSKLIANDDHPLVALFPLHENDKKEALIKKWFKFESTFRSPLQEIRDYFGEAIALYFAFLTFYNRALLIPALVGLAFFIYQLADFRVDVDAVPAYAIFVALWASLFLEFWKRAEASYRIKWGMTKFLEKEQPRPEFKGEWLPNPVDGRQEEMFPFLERLRRVIISQTVVWSLIGVVIACVVGVFFLRKVLNSKIDPTAGNYITAFINAVQIQILNFIYGLVSRNLNDYENHRTDTEYMNNLIAKTFLFKFVNSYNTLFYIAFFKRNDDSVGGCLENDCLGELRIQLGTIFVAAIVVNNALEILLPKLMTYIRDRQNRQEQGVAASGQKLFAEKSGPEQEFELENYESTFDDFDEMVVQYGFVTLFVVAFPAAPLLALINNIIETRVDSLKVTRLTRRPEPRGAANIGTWFDILNMISLIAVVTNVALVCFSTKLMENWVSSEHGRLLTFVLAEHFILLLKFAIAYFVPDEPLSYSVHVARQDYVVNVLINGMEEEPDNIPPASDGAITASAKAEFPWERVSETIRLNTGHEW